MHKPIIVVYLGCKNLSSAIINEALENVSNAISSPTGEYIVFVVPDTDRRKTKIECISPTLITINEQLKKAHLEKMEKINKNFQKILNTFPYKNKLLIEKIKKA